MSVIVRRAEAGDAADIAEIFASEDVIKQTAQVPHRGSEFWQKFYAVRDANGTELVGVVDGKVVGHLGILTSTAFRRRHVASFGIGVNVAYHGRGVGKALMAEMIHLCDNWLNIVRLELAVFTDNAPAIALYEKFGFEREGVTRFDLFKDGKYGHSLHMARFNPNYKAILAG